ncbi:MAG: hypothetical protein ACR2M9_01810 [Cyanophyceae cyanobacterium]
MQHAFTLFLVFVLTAKATATDCNVVISELNSDDIGRGEFFEFIELMSTCRNAQLRNYILLIVKEYDSRLKGPSIVFSADFYLHAFQNQKNFFVIGSPNEALKDKVNLPFTSNSVMFYRKAQISPQGQTTLGAFFKKSDAPEALTDVVPNGNDSPMAAILLKQENQNRDRNEGISTLRLSYRDDRSHRHRSVPHKKITQEMENLIKSHLHDIIVYSRRSVFNDCGFFKRLITIPSEQKQFELTFPAREWDSIGHTDMSLNRCPRSPSDVRKKFLFTDWKLGKRTPGEENDCSGAKWIIEETLPNILADQGVDMSTLRPDSDPGVTVPPSCSRSSNVAGLVAAKSANVLKNRDGSITGGSGVSQCIDLTEEEKRRQLILDASLDRFTDKITAVIRETKRAHSHVPESKTTNEPPAKVRCADESNKPVQRPWLDNTHFSSAIVRQIDQYQGQYVKTSWLTPARKAWLKYIFNSANPAESKFQCRFCAEYVKKHGIRQQMSDFASETGFFEANYEKMRHKLKSHATQKTHLLAEAEIKQTFAGEMDQCLMNWRQEAEAKASKKDLVTSRMVRSVYVETLNNVPLDTHAQIVQLQQLNGIDMGVHHYERTSATRMMDCIASEIT